ncbi:hypothetical protein [Thalassobacillus sp. B23F22_16]|uniref:hypothetical protein n=1 Tax=Thalassobacillus sp. B23F22_16 TaxID=3459513 RepID=UPI00373E577D
MTMKTFLVVVALGTGLFVSGMVSHADQTSQYVNADVQASDQSPVPLSNGEDPPANPEDETAHSLAAKTTSTPYKKDSERENESTTDRVNYPTYTSPNQSAYSVQAPSSPPYFQNVPAANPGTYYPVVKDPIYLLYDKALNQLFKDGQLNSLTIVLVIIIGYMIRYNHQPQMTESGEQTDHTARFLKKYIHHFLMILTIICLLIALFIAKQILVLLI